MCEAAMPFFLLMLFSLRASSPIWASKASLARTRERAAKAFSRGSLRLSLKCKGASAAMNYLPSFKPQLAAGDLGES